MRGLLGRKAWQKTFILWFQPSGWAHYMIVLNVIQWYLISEVQTLCDPMDGSLLGSSVHGISQVRILEWVAISFSRWSSPPGTEPVAPASPALPANSLPLGYLGHLSRTQVNQMQPSSNDAFQGESHSAISIGGPVSHLFLFKEHTCDRVTHYTCSPPSSWWQDVLSASCASAFLSRTFSLSWPPGVTPISSETLALTGLHSEGESSLCTWKLN